MNAVRKFLKRIRPAEALYVSMRATPTVRDGLTYAGYRLLVWLVDGMRFSRRLSVGVSSVTRRLHVTFALSRPGRPPARLTLPVYPQAFWTLVEVFHYAIYSPLVSISPRTVVDAGANIGLAAVFLHGLYPEAHFVCVEPDPSNLPMLRRNLSQNGVSHTVVAAALGRAAGQAKLRTHKGASEYSSTRATTFPDSEYSVVGVAATTLAEVRASVGADRGVLLKIDIEGGEFDVLGGAGSALAGIEYLTGEFHGFAGDVGRLAEDLCAASGLSLLRREGTDELATLHFGRPPAQAQLPPSTPA